MGNALPFAVRLPEDIASAAGVGASLFVRDGDALRASLVYPGAIIVMPPLLLTSAVVGGTIAAVCGVPEGEIREGAATIESIAAQGGLAESIGVTLAGHLQSGGATAGGVEVLTELRFQGLRERDEVSRPYAVQSGARRAGTRSPAPANQPANGLPTINPRLALAVVLVVSARSTYDGADFGHIVVEYESVPRRFGAWTDNNGAQLRREFEEARREMLEALCVNARRRP